jgi:hypothetical protein
MAAAGLRLPRLRDGRSPRPPARRAWNWRGLTAGAPVLFGTLMILAAVLAIGRPVVFPDTDDYYMNGKEMALSLAYATHLRAVPGAPTDPEEIADAREKALEQKAARQGLEARSPFYGLFLFAARGSTAYGPPPGCRPPSPPG